ncbi:hypothetical protein [Mycobacterium sp.]|uniref:hypothetical protein n=1 Tax=Mycobacterium sp. TaxID=1785 RepID=UPI0033420320
MAAVFTCAHCNAVPEQVVDGKAAIAWSGVEDIQVDAGAGSGVACPCGGAGDVDRSGERETEREFALK